MILRDIYYGRLQVERIYQDDVIVWERPWRAKEDAHGFLTIKTNAIGSMPVVTFVFAHGECEISDYSDVTGVVASILRIAGDGMSATDIDALCRALPVVLMHADEKIVSNDDAFGRALPVDVASSKIEIETFNYAGGIACDAIVSESDIRISSYDEVSGHVCTVIVSEVKQEIVTDYIADCHVCRVIVADSIVKSILAVDSKAHAHDIITAASAVDIYSSSISVSCSYMVVDSFGNAIVVSKGDGLINARDVTMMYGDCRSSTVFTGCGINLPFTKALGVYTSNTDSVGTTVLPKARLAHGISDTNMFAVGYASTLSVTNIHGQSETCDYSSVVIRTWELPVEIDHILYIRQVYEIIDIDAETLEVI